MGLRKQVSIQVPIEDWRALRDEAIKRKISITQLCIKLMEAGGMNKVRINNPDQIGRV